MKQLTVISGKGGTGKTSIVGAFAALAENKVLADCDVDAADLHLLLQPKVIEEQDFKALKKAVIDESKCVRCGACVEHCRFQAIENYSVNPLSCDGCGVCEYVCPVNAVRLGDKVAGKAYISETRFGPLCHARLHPGEDASGKLVTLVRNNARKIAEEKGHDLIIIDGSPGIGCPVIASLGGVDLALIVTEPTLSGIHDLGRILEVTEHFKVKSLVCVNKCDINLKNTADITEYCMKRGVNVVGKIPYDQVFTKAQIEGKTVIEYEKTRVCDILKDMWAKIEKQLGND